jgi:gallate decarboxylase subunit D
LADEALLFAAGEGGRRIEAWVRRMGPDLVVAVGGGSRPHVGCAVLATARPSTADPSQLSASISVLTVPPHKEEPIARFIAERLAKVTGGSVVVTAGIHEDGLDRDGVMTYVRLARNLADEIAQAVDLTGR